MLDDVMECLFESKEDVMTDLRGEGPGRQMDWNIQTAADLGGAEKILSEATEVGHEAIQSVVFGVDGPNDFVHRASQFAGRLVDLVDIGGDLRLAFKFA